MGVHKVTAISHFNKLSKKDQLREVKRLLVLHKNIYKRDTNITEHINKGLAKVQYIIILLEKVIQEKDIEMFRREYLKDSKRL